MKKFQQVDAAKYSFASQCEVQPERARFKTVHRTASNNVSDFWSREVGILGTTGVGDFLHWVTERENVRLKREAGAAAPWTTDNIISTYRFCNVRRKHDRVSQWIIKNVITPHRKHPDLWIMLALARYINWPDTLQEIMDARLWPSSGTPHWCAIGNTIDARAARKEQTYTGAYMIRAESNPRAEWYSWGKGRYVAEIVIGRELWANRNAILPEMKKRSVRQAWAAISNRYGWGSFMAGQVIADLTYSPLLAKARDLYAWAPLGPGSKRGLNRLLGRELTKALPQSHAVHHMVKLRDQIVSKLGSQFGDMTLHDVQNCLCEYDKWARVKNGEGKPRSLYRPPESAESATA